MLWKGFQRPKRLDFERETLTDRFGRFYAQPFERGFGTTVGNALRRVLLSSIEGAAITAVKIDGVLHEFSPIKGVVEDATDIILNLKQLPLKCHVDYTKTLTRARRQAGRRSAPATSRPTPTSRSSSRTRTSPPSPRAASCTWSCASSAAAATSRPTELRRGPRHRLDPDRLGALAGPARSTTWSRRRASARPPTTTSSRSKCGPTARSRRGDAVSLAAKLVRDHLNIFINLDDDDDDEVGHRRPNRPASASPTSTSTRASRNSSSRCAPTTA